MSDPDYWHSVINQENVIVFLALIKGNKEEIVGMLTLGMYRTCLSLKGWIEDVVVDENHRRMGIGKALMEKAITTC